MLIACGVVLAALLTAGWFWLRDSSLVAVRRVAITGVGGRDARGIRRALVNAARTMTTLDVNVGELRTAVAPYPVVKDLEVTTDFPHGLRIRVIEEVPIGLVPIDGHKVAVAADGVLLRDVKPRGALPLIPVRVPPGGTRLAEQADLDVVALLGAAPHQLLARISQATSTSAHGLVAQLRNGPTIYFGAPTRLRVKWISVLAVLGASGSAGAEYIDVSDPQRPVAGAVTGGPGSASGTSGATASATSNAAGAASTLAGAAGTGAGAAVTGTGAAGTGTGAAGTAAGAAGTAAGAAAGTGTGSAIATTTAAGATATAPVQTTPAAGTTPTVAGGG